MAARVLVTGGAGFIGSHVCRALLAQGDEPVAYDNLFLGSRDRVPEGVPLVVGDIGDEPLVREILTQYRIDAVCHLAARVSIRASSTDFYEDADTNVMGTLAIARSVLATGVRQVVFASSMAVYADQPTPAPISEDADTRPISPYGIGKLTAEQFLLNILGDAGVDVVVLRLFNTFGQGQTFTPYVGAITIFTRALLRGEPITIYGDGSQVRDFVSVRDVARAFATAVATPGLRDVCNIGSGRPRSVSEVAALLRDRIRPDAAIVHVPRHRAELVNSVAGLARARERIGYQPAVTLESEIDGIIESIRARLEGGGL